MDGAAAEVAGAAAGGGSRPRSCCMAAWGARLERAAARSCGAQGARSARSSSGRDAVARPERARGQEEGASSVTAACERGPARGGGFQDRAHTARVIGIGRIFRAVSPCAAVGTHHTCHVRRLGVA